MQLPEESLWCSKCKREHGSESLGVVWIRHVETQAESVYVIEDQEGLDNLQQSIDAEHNQYELLEIDTLCK